MYYERIIDKNDLNRILREYLEETRSETGKFEESLIKFTQNGLKQGEESLFKRFDYYCKSQILEVYYNPGESPYEELLKSKLVGCLSLSAPRFYKTFRQVREILAQRSQFERDIVNRCVVFENNEADIKNCIKNRTQILKELISYDISNYGRELENFKNNIYH
jgi:hypothetical protein